MFHEAFLSDGSLIPRTGPTYQSCQALSYPDAPSHCLDASDIFLGRTPPNLIWDTVFMHLFMLSLHQEHTSPTWSSPDQKMIGNDRHIVCVTLAEKCILLKIVGRKAASVL